MKKLLIMIGLLFCFTFGFGATVYLPEDTVEVVSCDYSSGGGDKVIVYVEVLVKDKYGDYHMYSETKGSLLGVIGFGRFGIPERFDFIIQEGVT